MNILATSWGTAEINIDATAYVAVFIAILLIIVGAITVLSKVSEARKKKNQFTREKNRAVPDKDNTGKIIVDPNDPNVIMAHDLIQKLVDRGLEKLLLEDNFTPSFRLHNLDTGNQEILKRQLSEIMSEIFSYLNLPQGAHLSITYRTRKSTDNKQTGSYSGKGAFQRQIQIEIEPQYNKDNILAVLCHECTHYFMELNKLTDEHSYYNEIMTDTLANLIGFGNIMVRGYRKNTSTQIVGNQIMTSTIKIGYLDSEECETIFTVRNLERNHIKELISRRDEDKAYQKIETLKSLIVNIEAIMPSNSYFRSISTKSQQSYELIRSIILEYDALEISDELQKSKNLIANKHNNVQIEQAILRLKNIYTKLTDWKKSGYIK